MSADRPADYVCTALVDLLGEPDALGWEWINVATDVQGVDYVPGLDPGIRPLAHVDLQLHCLASRCWWVALAPEIRTVYWRRGPRPEPMNGGGE